MHGTKQINKQTVRESVEKKIQGFGFCCGDRSFQSKAIVAYGASEMMQVWLDEGLVDCAIVVCEGAGTVVATRGRLVQSIGARLTGIVKTSPITEIIRHIEAEGGHVLDEATARIDQTAGVNQAIELGFKHIAVSVASFQAKTISEIRQLETQTNADIVVFSICNTCADKQSVEHISRADIVCAGASKLLRNEVAPKTVMQLGIAIPVYAMTQKGKRLILSYLQRFGDKLVVFRTSKLPYEARGKGPRLRGD